MRSLSLIACLLLLLATPLTSWAAAEPPQPSEETAPQPGQEDGQSDDTEPSEEPPSDGEAEPECD